MHISCSSKEPANNLHPLSVPYYQYHISITNYLNTITTLPLPLPCDKTLQPFHSENMVLLVLLFSLGPKIFWKIIHHFTLDLPGWTNRKFRRVFLLSVPNWLGCQANSESRSTIFVASRVRKWARFDRPQKLKSIFIVRSIFNVFDRSYATSDDKNRSLIAAIYQTCLICEPLKLQKWLT